MLKILKRPTKRAKTMAQILKLKDASAPWRKLIDAFRETPQEGIVQNEDNQAVAVVLPMEVYQLYQGEWERDFAVVDRIREKMKGFDPDEVQANIDKAVEEVKAKSRPTR